MSSFHFSQFWSRLSTQFLRATNSTSNFPCLPLFPSLPPSWLSLRVSFLPMPMAWRASTTALSITFDDPDAGKITGADKKIIEDAVVTSFNNVHDTSVIKLESFKLSSFKPGSVLSKILPGYLGGSYSYGGGKGNNCRMCGSGTSGTGKRYAYLTRTLFILILPL